MLVQLLDIYDWFKADASLIAFPLFELLRLEGFLPLNSLAILGTAITNIVNTT